MVGKEIVKLLFTRISANSLILFPFKWAPFISHSFLISQGHDHILF